MESESFVSRVMALIQKSRRALRLYSSAGSHGFSRDGSSGELPAAQVAQWREVNGLLLRKLSEAAEAERALGAREAADPADALAKFRSNRFAGLLMFLACLVVGATA